MGLTEQRQTAKNITDYRQNAKNKKKKNYRLHGPTLSIFFQKEEYIVFFLPFQEVTKDTTSQLFSQIYHKTRVLKSVCTAYENFYKATRLVLHIMREMLRLILKENYFQFNGKLYLQTHRTAMGTKTAVSSANIFMSYIETQSLS